MALEDRKKTTHGKVSDESRCGGRPRAVPKRAEPVPPDPLPEDAPPFLPLRLERRLERVDGGENHTEQGRRDRREDGFERLREALESGVGGEEGEDAYVGGGVAEPVDGRAGNCTCVRA